MRAIREQVVTAVDLVVQVTRFASGHRRVTAISEVTAIDPENDQIRLEDIYTLSDPKQPILRHTGYITTFAPKMIERGDFEVDVFL